MTTVSERLKFLMDSLDMKQTELADAVEISKQSLYKYLHCKCEPRASVIAKMAVALNTSADFIVGLTNDPSPINRNSNGEEKATKETKLLSMFRKLSPEDKIRIEERISFIIENQ